MPAPANAMIRPGLIITGGLKTNVAIGPMVTTGGFTVGEAGGLGVSVGTGVLVGVGVIVGVLVGSGGTSAGLTVGTSRIFTLAQFTALTGIQPSLLARTRNHSPVPLRLTGETIKPADKLSITRYLSDGPSRISAPPISTHPADETPIVIDCSTVPASFVATSL